MRTVWIRLLIIHPIPPPSNQTTPSTPPPVVEGGLRCTQINLHKTICANISFDAWMTDNNIHCGLVQEPYLNRNKVSGFINYKIFKGATKGTIRSLIIMKKSINAWLLTQFSDGDQVAITVKTKDKTYVLASIYMPYDAQVIPPSTLTKKLIDFCQNNRYEFLISADANSHHTVWGSSDINNRGDGLLNYIISKDLYILNKGSRPTFQVINRSEIIDITVASKNLEKSVVNWEVSLDESFSDHNYITFEIKEAIVLNNEDFRNIRKTDWTKYRQQLHTIGINFTGNDTIDSKARKIEHCITTAYENSCKLSKGKKGNRPPWWNPHLTNLKREVFKLKRRANRAPDCQATKECYRQARTEYKLEIKDAKSKNWQKFCTEIQSLNSTARLHKIMKTGNREEIGALKDSDGNYTTTPEQTLQVLLDAHFPNNDDIPDAPITDTNTGINNFDIYKAITAESVKASIGSFKPYKSPGIDGIYPALLQQGMDFLVDYLVDIYRDCIQQGKSPARWLETKVVFIPKPGKVSYDEANKFRPISLFPFPLKGLERIVHWHIEKFTLRNKLHKDIYAYRESMNCEDSLHSLLYTIEKALENGELVLFLDLTAAFSTVTIEGVIKNLKNMGCDTKILSWCKNLLENRVVIAFLHGGRVYKIVVRGTPQGAILSVVFWNVDSQDMQNRFPTGSAITTKSFADDSATIATGFRIIDLAKRIQEAANTITEWAKDNGLKHNASKCKMMLFTRSRSPIKPPIYINGEQVDYVSSFKYLGVTINEKLSWKDHITNITTKATNIFMQCRAMLGRTLGLSPRISRWTYTSLIRPILAYGIMVWIKGVVVNSHLLFLEKVQRKACLATLNCMNSTPTAGMEVILNLEPISIFLRSQAILTYNRLIKNGNWKCQQSEKHVFVRVNHISLINRLATQIPSLDMPCDKMINREHIDTNFQTTILPRAEMNRSILRPKPTRPKTIYVFTDGSRFNNMSGCGFIIKNYENTLHISGFEQLGQLATVYQAELQALTIATQNLLNRSPINQNIYFFIDNQAVIQSVGKYEIKSKQILECKNLLNKLAIDNTLRILWVPGQAGHLGNEVADRLAKLGVQRVVNGPEPIIPISDAKIKDDVKTWRTEKHQKYWSEMTKCRQTRMILPTINNNAWKQIQNLSRRKIKIITQMLTGHATLNKHLFIMKIEEDPTCPKCLMADETVEHYLADCPAYQQPGLTH